MTAPKRLLLIGTGRGGKSLLAANIAAEAARRGCSSALHDISPRQQNLTRWEDQARRNGFTTPPLTMGRGSTLPKLSHDAKLLVVDTPAYNGLDEWFERVGETLPHCVGSIIVWNPDPSGAWSVADLVQNVAAMAPDAPVVVLANRFRPSTASKASFAAIPPRFRPVLIETVMHERATFSEAFGAGSDIASYPKADAQARAEFQAIFNELVERFELPVSATAAPSITKPRTSKRKAA